MVSREDDLQDVLNEGDSKPNTEMFHLKFRREVLIFYLTK